MDTIYKGRKGKKCVPPLKQRTKKSPAWKTAGLFQKGEGIGTRELRSDLDYGPCNLGSKGEHLETSKSGAATTGGRGGGEIKWKKPSSLGMINEIESYEMEKASGYPQDGREKGPGS